jgi:hypothetical protein
MEGAKIHAENSIRQKNQALNYRRMSARIDAVASRVQTAITTKQVGGILPLVSVHRSLSPSGHIIDGGCGQGYGISYEVNESGEGNHHW